MRVLDLASGAAATGVDANELANADKGALGGYDRDGAVYYSFPRAAPLPLLRMEKVIEEEPDQRLLTQRYTREAIAAETDAPRENAGTHKYQ